MTPRSYRRCFFALLAAVIGFRLVYLLLTPLTLTSDEAYYWDWSRHLDWSYYSKGPLVAYLIALSTGLGGHSEFFVRLPAVLMAALTLMALYKLALRLFRSTRYALWTALVFCCIPVFNAGSLLLTIDNPLLCFWTLALYALHRALADGRRRRWWLAAGVCLGLGTMAKAAMLFFVPGLFLYLVLSREQRPRLATPGPWLLLGLGLLGLLPQVIWNANHDWVMFRDFARKGGADEGWALAPLEPLRLLATQAGIFSPLIFAALAWGIWKSLGRFARREEPWLFLVSFFLPVLGFYLLLSLKTKVNPNWPLAGYPSALIAAVGLWMERWDALRRRADEADAALRLRRFRRWTVGGLALGLFLSYALFLTQPLYWIGLPLPAKLDPSNRLYGYEQMAERAAALQAERARATGAEPFLAARKYQMAAQLAFHVPGHPHPYCLRENAREDQYYFWNDLTGLAGRDAIFVAEKDRDMERVDHAFEEMQLLERVEVRRGRRVVKHFDLYLGRDFRGWEFDED